MSTIWIDPTELQDVNRFLAQQASTVVDTMVGLTGLSQGCPPEVAGWLEAALGEVSNEGLAQALLVALSGVTLGLRADQIEADQSLIAAAPQLTAPTSTADFTGGRVLTLDEALYPSSATIGSSSVAQPVATMPDGSPVDFGDLIADFATTRSSSVAQPVATMPDGSPVDFGDLIADFATTRSNRAKPIMVTLNGKPIDVPTVLPFYSPYGVNLPALVYNTLPRTADVMNNVTAPSGLTFYNGRYHDSYGGSSSSLADSHYDPKLLTNVF